MFRAECKAGTELGKMASAIMASGGLITDDITNGIVANRISQPDCAGGFLLDGYPRTVPQAEYFAGLLRERGLPQPVVIFLDVPTEALVARLTARRQCPKCLRIYNVLFQPPRVEGKMRRRRSGPDHARGRPGGHHSPAHAGIRGDDRSDSRLVRRSGGPQSGWQPAVEAVAKAVERAVIEATGSTPA